MMATERGGVVSCACFGQTPANVARATTHDHVPLHTTIWYTNVVSTTVPVVRLLRPLLRNSPGFRGQAMIRIHCGRTVTLAAALLALSSLRSSAHAQRDGGQPDSLYTRQHYDKAEYMVPMRDGVKLYTIVYTPKDTSVAVPIMLVRTPYGIPPYGLTDYKRVLGPSVSYTHLRAH